MLERWCKKWRNGEGQRRSSIGRYKPAMEVLLNGGAQNIERKRVKKGGSSVDLIGNRQEKGWIERK